jgi:hypothetical protein
LHLPTNNIALPTPPPQRGKSSTEGATMLLCEYVAGIPQTKSDKN